MKRKIDHVIVELDDNTPEYMEDVIRCGSVKSYDADGELLEDHQNLIDNTEYNSSNELILDISNKLGVSEDLITIED